MGPLVHADRELLITIWRRLPCPDSASQHRQKFTKANCLIAPEVPGFGQHPFDHCVHLLPILLEARPQEVTPCMCSRAMGTDDVCDDGG